MAQIFSFPASPQEFSIKNQLNEPEPAASFDKRVPAEFMSQIVALKTMHELETVDYHEIPSAKNIAEFGVGVSLGVKSYLWRKARQANEANGRDSAVFGWVMLHYSQQWNEAWGSQWRCTGFFRQSVVEESEAGLITQMYWDYANELLSPLAVGSINGAVTLTKNEFFDSSASSELSAAVTGCEMRASWSPVLSVQTASIDAPANVNSWAGLMLAAAGDEEREQKR